MVTEWKELARELVYQKYARKISKVDFQMPNGSISDFYIKEEKPTVAIVALTPENRVILARQFRPGPKKIFSELPGGYVDQAEEPTEAGKRELLEETGYTGDLQAVTTCYDDAYSTVVRTVVVAKNCTKVQDQTLEQNEYVDVHLSSLEDFRNLLRSGEMTDVEAGYLALDHLGLL